MSMGPTKEVKVEVSKFDRVRHAVKKAASAYFEKPLYYLFYSLLGATSVALLFNRHLPWQYYVLLLALAGIEAHRQTRGAKTDAKPTTESR